MTVTQQKLDELEILQSIYPEFIVIDDQDLLYCRQLSTNSSKQPALRFTVKLSNIELDVCLPGSYPNNDIAEIRIAWSSLASDIEFKIKAIIKTTVLDGKGQPIVLSVLSNVLDVLSSHDYTNMKDSTESCIPEQIILYNRIWYYSHHIYSKEKRTNMIQWSKDLTLNGFILPGKPGIICIEGTADECKDFNLRIRAMNWQLLKLQHEELELSFDQLKFNSFQEMIFEVHGRANNHQNLGQFREFLENIDLGNIFQILFKI